MGGNLQGRVAVIAGSGRSVGPGTAKKLSEEGASVVISDANEDNTRNGVAEMETMGGETIYILADVSKYEDTRNLIDAITKEVRSLDILMNSAGINKDRMLHEMSVNDWNAVITADLTEVFNCMRIAVNYIREREYRHIINISSASYLSGNIGRANYAATKTEVVALTKTCTKENEKENITCNAIVPGFIDTEMTGGMPEKAWDIMVGKISMDRISTPEDIGNMIAFLASDEASYITQGVLEMSDGMIL